MVVLSRTLLSYSHRSTTHHRWIALLYPRPFPLSSPDSAVLQSPHWASSRVEWSGSNSNARKLLRRFVCLPVTYHVFFIDSAELPLPNHFFNMRLKVFIAVGFVQALQEFRSLLHFQCSLVGVVRNIGVRLKNRKLIWIPVSSDRLQGDVVRQGL